MLSILKNILTASDFNNFSKIHDSYTITYVRNDREIMGHKEIAQIKFRLEIIEQIENLGLHRDV